MDISIASFIIFQFGKQNFYQEGKAVSLALRSGYVKIQNM